MIIHLKMYIKYIHATNTKLSKRVKKTIRKESG